MQEYANKPDVQELLQKLAADMLSHSEQKHAVSSKSCFGQATRLGRRQAWEHCGKDLRVSLEFERWGIRTGGYWAAYRRARCTSKQVADPRRIRSSMLERAQRHSDVPQGPPQRRKNQGAIKG
eukprot:1160963-Pelagomonas_calceolata.AAC.14